ncbi:MAG: ribose-phosphate pyrophosphokinase [Legionellaceae bacterium]|nr:ribose-phosphate pyrophosphokinase [Legionellaceae bacterium]
MKKTPIIFPLFDTDALAQTIHTQCQYELGKIDLHQFPDGESLIKLNTDVAGRDVFLSINLNHPNTKLLPLLFAAETAKSLGCLSVILIAPYLPYMRQDKVFEPGQGITATYFATLISNYFDAMITIDPHLHRFHHLSAIYKIPTHLLHAAKHIAEWIHQHVKNPVLIGPDSESSQWIEDIANQAGTPYLVLEKTREGDTAVQISIPQIENHPNATPVLIDDIISTGTTMIEAVKALQLLKMTQPICIGIHALCSDDDYQKLCTSGAKRIVTCNTIPHPSNTIDINTAIVDCLRHKKS